ncbi:hypothetical protein CEXT_695621 [Caerostris extrusa]|uniref:G-protein coupled receptors family 1 profile domain-containing protein n=1 Tax=Caerostris extrusa TaxID=172846 RepID=A0AAV4SLX3_CAEEX|nr:hypothetical protein CEXT_695621 [Caerostris extrusa]
MLYSNTARKGEQERLVMINVGTESHFVMFEEEKLRLTWSEVSGSELWNPHLRCHYLLYACMHYSCWKHFSPRSCHQIPTTPFHHQSVASQPGYCRHHSSIPAVWLCSAAISFIPIFLGWYSDQPVSIFDPSSQCSLTVNHIYATVSSLTLTSFYLPILPIMFYVYFRILMVAEHQAREIKQLEISLQGAGTHGMRRSLRRRSRW